MTFLGGLLAGIMLIILARSFSSVPDGSSATALVEAITPWNIFASLGLFALFVGLIFWVVGWFFGRHNEKNQQLSNIEERLEAVEQKTSAV